MLFSAIAQAINKKFGTSYTRNGGDRPEQALGLSGHNLAERQLERALKAKSARTESQRKAVLWLNRAERELGAGGSALVHGVLVKGLTMRKFGQRRGLESQRWKDYFSRRLRECLDRLAPVYGFAMENKAGSTREPGLTRRFEAP